MVRRNSAQAHNKEGSSTSSTPKSSFDAKNSPGATGMKQKLVHRHLWSESPVNRSLPFSSPRFPMPPGETPKLPPKPKQSGQSELAHLTHQKLNKNFSLSSDRSNMFQYPN
jgi:hypothetical protein